jgi:predicted nucleic acid-binding protein
VLVGASAIHLATAQQLGTDLKQLVAYDTRVIEAASNLGITTACPH